MRDGRRILGDRSLAQVELPSGSARCARRRTRSCAGNQTWYSRTSVWRPASLQRVDHEVARARLRARAGDVRTVGERAGERADDARVGSRDRRRLGGALRGGVLGRVSGELLCAERGGEQGAARRARTATESGCGRMSRGFRDSRARTSRPRCRTPAWSCTARTARRRR